MKHQIAMFKFTLGNGQSISPSALQALWMSASRSQQVSVGRETGPGGREGRPTYSLYASQALQDLPQVELRLRKVLEERNLSASLIALHD